MSYTYLPSFIARDAADDALTRLWDGLAWDNRDDAPRLEYWQNNFGLPYTYGRGAGTRTYSCLPWDDFIFSTMEDINRQFGFGMNCCFVNGYRDGSDSLGWHADDSPEMNPAEPVLSLSLGAERDIMVRANGTTDIERIRLGHGSLFIMPAGYQQSHQHKIPKAGFVCGPRISLTYRGMIA